MINNFIYHAMPFTQLLALVIIERSHLQRNKKYQMVTSSC